MGVSKNGGPSIHLKQVVFLIRKPIVPGYLYLEKHPYVSSQQIWNTLKKHSMYVCMYVCVYVCMYMVINVYIYIHSMYTIIFQRQYKYVLKMLSYYLKKRIAG